MLEDALALARRGWRVFPIKAGTKDAPMVKWGTEATSDPDVVRAWWTKPGWESSNIGIACGPSGLCVVDLDMKGEEDGRAELDALELVHGALPPTLEARTPSGGHHLYFLGEAATTVRALGPGIDTRSASGAGGYVVAPPSVLRSGAGYSWANGGAAEPVALPEWVRDAAGAPRTRRSREEEAVVELDSDWALAWAARHLSQDAEPAVEGQGGDERTLRLAFVLRDKGLSEAAALALMLEHYNPRCQPPWEPEEMEQKVANAYGYANVMAPGADSPLADFPDLETEGEVPQPHETARYVGPMDEWVWVAGVKRFVRRADAEKLDVQAFNSQFNWLASQKGDLTKELFASKTAIRRFMGLAYRPCEDEFLGERYNLWKPSGVEPVEGGAPWLIEHAHFLLPNEREANLLLDYLAWMVQRPKDKLAFAMLMQGKQGTGKSWIGRLMEAIIGTGNTSRPSNDEIHSDFNAWASKAQLVVIEELMSAGRRETGNKLKTLITDPRVRVNEKHQPPYTIENYMNFLIFTNWEDPVPIENGDRRYMVFMSPVHRREDAYYDRIFGHLRSADGPGLALGELLRRDISGFNGLGVAPSTAAKEDMRRSGMHDVEAWLLEAWELGRAPFAGDLVATTDLVAALPERLKRAPRLHNVVGQFLRNEVGARPLGQHRLPASGERARLWSLRRHELWEQVVPSKRAWRYERDAELREPIPDGEDDLSDLLGDVE